MKRGFVAVFTILICCTSCNYFCTLWGSHKLSENIILLLGDHQQQRAIVLCPENYSGVCCMGGAHLIPSFEESHYNYVQETISNDDWIIANTINSRTQESAFWIIDCTITDDELDCYVLGCDSLSIDKILGPLDTLQFDEKRRTLNIDLQF